MSHVNALRNKRLLDLEAHLNSRIIAQEHVIPRVAAVIRRGELGLSHPSRPKGSFIFLGPTGVGKTELTLELARFLWGEDEKLHRFDMSEFQLQASLPALIGDASGDLGRLGRVLTTEREGILLFDEMEKAHPLILDVFLQIVDAGRVTVGAGQVCDVTGFYIVFTSNIAASGINKTHAMPFALVEKNVLRQLAETVRPEFAARINEKIVFKKLDYEAQRRIAEMVLSAELNRHAQAGYHVRPTPAVVEFLIRKGIDRYNGARPMRNVVETMVGDAIARNLLTGGNGSGDLVVVGQGLDAFLGVA